MTQEEALKVVGLIIEAVRKKDEKLTQTLIQDYPWTRLYLTNRSSKYHYLVDVLSVGFIITHCRSENRLRESRGLKPLLVVIVKQEEGDNRQEIHFRFTPVGPDNFHKID